MTEHILSMLGLALKAGRVEVGEEPVGAAARAKTYDKVQNVGICPEWKHKNCNSGKHRR